MQSANRRLGNPGCWGGTRKGTEDGRAKGVLPVLVAWPVMRVVAVLVAAVEPAFWHPFRRIVLDSGVISSRIALKISAMAGRAGDMR